MFLWQSVEDSSLFPRAPYPPPPAGALVLRLVDRFLDAAQLALPAACSLRTTKASYDK